MDKKNEKLPQCAHCVSRACAARTDTPGEGEAPCMLPDLTSEQEADLVAFYGTGLPARIMEASNDAVQQAIAEKWGHCREVAEFCRNMGFKRIGIASCISFHEEARELSRRLKAEGFEVFSAICKTGELTKADVGLDVCDPDCPACNPRRQAQLLNEKKTDLNLVLGLCVGHDALFIKQSDALVSPYIVKDWGHDHNPRTELRAQ